MDKESLTFMLVGPGGVIKQMVLHKAFSKGSDSISSEDWVLSEPQDYANYLKYQSPPGWGEVLKARKKHINLAFTAADKGITFDDNGGAKYTASGVERSAAISNAKKACIEEDYQERLAAWEVHAQSRRDEGKTAKKKPKRNPNVPRDDWLAKLADQESKAETEYKNFCSNAAVRKRAEEAHKTPKYENDGNGMSQLQVPLDALSGMTLRKVQRVFTTLIGKLPLILSPPPDVKEAKAPDP